jgi:glutaredoxin-dependent peroxiredoxin
MPLEIGTPAPDLILPVAPGAPPVNLAAYRESQPVVVAFFPLAFSSVCTEEICQLQEDMADWDALDAAVLGVSVDSIFVNLRFAEETGATFPILSDFNREAVTAWGVRNDDYFGMRGVANRAVFVVDPAGRIAYSWMSLDSDLLPDLDAVKDTLRSMPPRR